MSVSGGDDVLAGLISAVEIDIVDEDNLIAIDLTGRNDPVDIQLLGLAGAPGPQGPPGAPGSGGSGVAKGGARANTTTWAAQTVNTTPQFTMFRPTGWNFSESNEGYPDYNPTFVTGATANNRYAFDLAPPYSDEPGWFIQSIRCQVGFAGTAPPHVHFQTGTWWGEFFEATYNVVQPSLATQTTLPHVKIMCHQGPFYRPAYDPAQDGYYFGGVTMQWSGTTAIPQSPTGGAQPFCYVDVRRVG